MPRGWRCESRSRPTGCYASADLFCFGGWNCLSLFTWSRGVRANRKIVTAPAEMRPWHDENREMNHIWRCMGFPCAKQTASSQEELVFLPVCSTSGVKVRSSVLHPKQAWVWSLVFCVSSNTDQMWLRFFKASLIFSFGLESTAAALNVRL